MVSDQQVVGQEPCYRPAVVAHNVVVLVGSAAAVVGLAEPLFLAWHQALVSAAEAGHQQYAAVVGTADKHKPVDWFVTDGKVTGG